MATQAQSQVLQLLPVMTLASREKHEQQLEQLQQQRQQQQQQQQSQQTYATARKPSPKQQQQPLFSKTESLEAPPKTSTPVAAASKKSSSPKHEFVIRHQQQHKKQQHKKQEVFNDMSVGLMASGLAWVQKQRLQRQRQHLQTEAQKQVKKIEEELRKENGGDLPLSSQSERTGASTSTSTSLSLTITQQSERGLNNGSSPLRLKQQQQQSTIPTPRPSHSIDENDSNTNTEEATKRGGFFPPILQHITNVFPGGDGNGLFGGQSSPGQDPNNGIAQHQGNDSGLLHESMSHLGISVQLPLESTTITTTEEEEQTSPKREEGFWIPSVRVVPDILISHSEDEEEVINNDNTNEEDNNKKEHYVTPLILNKNQRQLIAIHVLPKTVSYCPWKRLYSLSRDGDSFDACLRLIRNSPKTLLVVRTTRNALFGAYSDSQWNDNGIYHGSAQSCLFTFSHPYDTATSANTDKIKVYKWQGVNRYIQYCDISNQRLAFGGGGVDGSFGLCVEKDFHYGSTGPCDTFGNEPLCNQENFDIVDVEIYGFLTGTF